jgi:hypothetical protein
MSEPGLFDPRAFDVAMAETERDRALRRVERAADPDWTRHVERVVARIAQRLPTFSTDEVWAALDESYSTHEPRALGAIMVDMARRGIIAPTDRTVKSRRPECHRRDVRVWRSRLR